MTQAIAAFFQGLHRRRPDPRLEKVNGTIRFDVRDGERLDHWLVRLSGGRFDVSKSGWQPADAVVVADAVHLDRTVRGEDRAGPSMLRGDLLVRGDWRLLISIERVLPGPPDTRGPHLRRRGET